MHPWVGFVPLSQPIMLIGVAQATLQLLSQNHLTHPQIHLLWAQEDRALIQHLMKGFMPFRLGARGIHLSDAVTPDSTPVGTTSITARACLPKHTSEGHQILLPHDDGTLLAVKFLSRARSWSCSLAITAKDGTD
jgi:hypothetical protein